MPDAKLNAVQVGNVLMSGYYNYKGVFLNSSSGYTRQLWANGTDTLYGPNTAAQLMGSNQGNFLQGGAADDTIYVINTADRISGGGGVDTAYATVDFTLPGDVENLTMNGRWSPVLGIANNANNILTAVNANVTLEGKGGDDVIVSAGGDTFKFGAGSGQDILVNFHPESDVVRLSDYGLSGFGQVKQAMTEVGPDTLLRLSSADSILFKGLGIKDFKAKDFQLSVDTARLKTTFADEFDSLNLQQQGHAKGWNAAYSWDSYNSHSAHTIFGESEVYVDPTFVGTGPAALGLNPFKINDGVLSISADPTPNWAKGALWGHDYTSGVLTTAGSFSQTYGYFEMRAQLPSGQGSFPAFWLLSEDGKYNEIDVMETVNGSNQVWNHIHYNDGSGSADRASVGFSTTTPGLSSGFHTYGLLWTAQTLTWYVDGAEVASTPTPAALNSSMYMLVNYAVGGSWAGAPNGSLGDMKIDYVRAYNLDNAPVEVDGGSTTAPTAPAAPPAPTATIQTGGGLIGTSGNDVFNLSPDAARTFTGYDAAGEDRFSVPTGTGGFHLAGAPQASLTMVDASAWWNNISGAQVVRWTGDPNAVDSAAKVNGLLQAMPGNQGGGVLVVGYTADHHVGLYYDADAAGPGAATLVATLDNLTDTRFVSADDFSVSGAATTTTPSTAPASNPAAATTSPGPAPAVPAPPPASTVLSGSNTLTGTAGADTFVLSAAHPETNAAFGSAGHDLIGLPTGATGFSLRGAAGQGAPNVVDASAWWNNISSAQVIRWTGDATAMDSAAKVDGVLEAMPGNQGGGSIVLAYTAAHHVGVYYDVDPAHPGGVRLVATLSNVLDTHSLGSGDFVFV